MIYVTSLDGTQQEPLINISDDFKMEQSVDGSFQISFTCFPHRNNPGYGILRSESIVTVDGYDFKVKQYSDNAFSKSVTAISTFFELSKVQKVGLLENSRSLRAHIDFALSGNGWNYTIDPDIANVSIVIENLGNDNVISLINKICSNHQVEYIILPNNNVRFSKQVGPDNDYQYRYKHNLSSVVLKEDTTNLYTYIRGEASDGFATSYTSPNVSTFGVLEAAPIKDERFENIASFQRFLKNSITDVPELAIESSVPELTSRETGERIWLIYEPLNIEMQTRILKQTKVLRNETLITSSVIFGNSLIKSAVDLLVSQKSEIDDNKENLNESKKEYTSRFTQTDERITLEVSQLNSSIATIDVKADQINLSVNNRITNEVSQIDIRANNIQLSVSELDTRTSSSINLLNDNINLKIDRGGAITDINLSPGNATINADKINLNGAVFVNGMITGSTSIQVDTDVILGRALRFSDFTALTTGGGNLTLEAFNDINYVGSSHYFNTESVFLNGKRVLTTDDL